MWQWPYVSYVSLIAITAPTNYIGRSVRTCVFYPSIIYSSGNESVVSDYKSDIFQTEKYIGGGRDGTAKYNGMDGGPSTVYIIPKNNNT